MTKRLFCFENELGFIEEGIFYSIHLNKLEFMRIICNLCSNNNYISADLLLKDSFRYYTNIDIFATHYKNKSISDSEFYMYWLNKIRNNKKFKLIFSTLQEEQKLINQELKKQKQNSKMPRSYSGQSIENYLRNLGFSRYNYRK